MADDHLIEQLRARRPAALSLLATTHGRELVGIAYLIADDHAAAEDAAARACADAWMAVAGTPGGDAGQLRRMILRRTVEHALELRRRSSNVDPRPVGAAAVALRALSPTERAVIGLAIVGELSAAEITAEMAISPGEVATLLARSDELRGAVEAALAGLPVRLDADAIRRALDRPPPAPRPRVPRGALAVAGAAAVVAWLAIAGPPSAPNPVRLSLPSAPPTPPLAAVPAVAHIGPVPAFTLSACQIEPLATPLIFAGWLTKAELGIGDAGAPAYALVTSGRAEWVGGTRDGPSFPRAVGRLACVYDPDAESYRAVGLGDAWLPPVELDGCPPSPSAEFGGYRELGGPGAFVLPSIGSAERVAGSPDVGLFVRMAPPDTAHGQIAATLRSLDGIDVVTARVDNEAPNVTGASSSRYVWVDEVDVPAAGCWVLNVTVDGAVVGVAAVPFRAAD